MKTPLARSLQALLHLSLIVCAFLPTSIHASSLEDHIIPHQPHDVETPPSVSPTTAAPSSAPSSTPSLAPSVSPSMAPSVSASMVPSMVSSNIPSLTVSPSAPPSASPNVESNIFFNNEENDEDPDPVQVTARGDDPSINTAAIMGIAAGGLVLLVGGFVARRRNRKEDLQSKGYFDFDPDDSYNQSTSSDDDVEV